MTASPETRPEGEETKVDEGDFAQRPEEESSQGRTTKIVLVIFLIALGVVAIPVLVTLFSSVVQEFMGEDVEEPDEPAQQTAPAEE